MVGEPLDLVAAFGRQRGVTVTTVKKSGPITGVILDNVVHRVLDICRRYDAVLALADTWRPGCVARPYRRGHRQGLGRLGGSGIHGFQVLGLAEAAGEIVFCGLFARVD